MEKKDYEIKPTYDTLAKCFNYKELNILNAFFQAKYGMFTCYDSIFSFGGIDFDPELIHYWERSSK